MSDNTSNQTISKTGELEEQVVIYSRAVCGLYSRMLSYACCVTDANKADYMELRSLVSQVYADDNIGLDLNMRMRDGSKKETILTNLEREYKETCLIYKDSYRTALNIYFENELESSFEGNTLQDPYEQKAFHALLQQAGKRVFTQLAASALSGSTEAQLLLGKSFFLGWGTPVDLDEGRRWIKTAAESGNAQALLYAGMAEETYHNRITGFRLNPDSTSYYEAAYAAGNHEAAYALYRFNRYHLSDQGSRRAEKVWLRRGCEDKDAYCLYERETVPKTAWAPGNVRNAADWIRAAAGYKEPDAFLLLARLFERGHAGLKADSEKAAECLRTAENL